VEAIVIGGGISGYITANHLLSVCKATKVTLVSSKEIPPIGVGEGTNPGFLYMLKSIGIDETEFINETNATIKWGVYYRGWWDEDFMNIFPKKPLTKADLDRTTTDILQGNDKGDIGYGLHFDCNRAISFLKKKAESNPNFSHLEGAAEVNWSGDQIESIQVGDKVIVAEYYVNCAKAGLFNESYVESPIYNNTAITCRTQGAGDFQYTDAMTMSAGWRWGIPLQDSVGYGYVFDKNYITEEKAKKELLDSIGEENLETKVIHYNSRYAESPFGKNYTTIGLAQNFFDPLDTLSLMSTIDSLILVIPHFKYRNSGTCNKNYNRLIYDMITHLNSQYFYQKRKEPYWKERSNRNEEVFTKDNITNTSYCTYIARRLL